jgi:hypothetical protein
MAMNGPHRGDCPFCNSKNTFTASMEMGVLKYNCFKLACDVGGRFDTDMTRAELESYFVKPLLESSSDNKELQPFVYPEHITTEGNATMRRFKQRWPVLAGESLMYDVKDKRAVFPIIHNGTVIDAIGRALDGATPKWYRYNGSADYYVRSMSDRNSVYVVVEDVISAITVAKKLPNSVGFAILGTSLTDKHLEYIQDNATKVIVALDPDALQKTLSYKKEIEMWTGLPSYALYLQDDLKYERPEDLDELRKLAYEEQDKPYG